jgi:hypothetical protein
MPLGDGGGCDLPRRCSRCRAARDEHVAIDDRPPDARVPADPTPGIRML